MHSDVANSLMAEPLLIAAGPRLTGCNLRVPLALLAEPEPVYLTLDRELCARSSKVLADKTGILLTVASQAEEAGKNWLVVTNAEQGLAARIRGRQEIPG